MTIQTHKKRLSKAIYTKEGWDMSYISIDQCIYGGHEEEVIYYAWDYIHSIHGQIRDFLALVHDIFAPAFDAAYSYAATMFSKYQAAEKCSVSHYELADTYIIKEHIEY